MALRLDRKSFVDILSEGEDKIGGLMLPPQDGVWGMPAEMLKTLPGYDPDVAKSRAEARRFMEKAGYGSDKQLSIKVAARNLSEFRDTSVVLIDQLKQIYIDGELELVETPHWLPRLARKDYRVAFIFSVGSVDDPDQKLYENYTCGAERNYTGYCNRELEQEFERQSSETDQDKRKQLVADRPQIAGTGGAADHRPYAPRHLLAALGQGPDALGQLALQRLAHGRRLARQINRDYGWPLRSRRAVSSVKAEWPRMVESRTSNHGLTAVPVTEGNVIC